MMRVGITGATGFLGSYLLRHLAHTGHYELRALTRTIQEGPPFAIPGVQWQQGDLASRVDCQEFIRNLDVVVHLAHTNTGLTSDKDLPADAAANLIPTLNLIEAIREEQRAIQLIYASSGGAIYGSSTTQIPFREDFPCLPESAYGIQKLTAEHYIRVTAERGSLIGTVLRISNPYGVLLPPQRTQGIIGVALHRIRLQQPVRVFVSLESVRDYLHLSDMATAVEKTFGQRAPYLCLNVGSGTGHTLAEVLSLIKECNPHMEIEHDASLGRGARLPHWNVLDVREAKKVLGWSPQVTLKDGIERLCREVRA